MRDVETCFSAAAICASDFASAPPCASQVVVAKKKAATPAALHSITVSNRLFIGFTSEAPNMPTLDRQQSTQKYRHAGKTRFFLFWDKNRGTSPVPLDQLPGRI